MGVTLTKTSGPNNIGPNMKIATYSAALDTAHATGGEVIDISGDFDYIHFACCGANDTEADNYMKFDIIHPGAGTAVTSTNVLITACWSADGTDGEVFKEITGDLTAVGELTILVIGS